jgi:hypothetical protein
MGLQAAVHIRVVDVGTRTKVKWIYLPYLMKKYGK